MILARNYLEVYPYENWSDKQMHNYEQGQTFQPTTLELTDGETSPPKLLTEADLIALMEKHGIGNDHLSTLSVISGLSLGRSTVKIVGCVCFLTKLTVGQS